MIPLLDGFLYDSLPYALLVLGLVITFRYLRIIDLTFAASFVLGPAVMAGALRAGTSVWIGLLGGCAMTLLLAAITVTLIQRLDTDPLLAGILANFAGYAAALLFTQGTLSISGHWTPLSFAGRLDAEIAGRVPVHPMTIAALAIVALGAKLALDRYLSSVHGIAFRAMEDSRSSGRLLRGLGFSPMRLQAAGIVVGNLLAMLSGVLVAWKQNQVTAQLGFDALITVITSYLVGVTIFEKQAMARSPVTAIDRILNATQRLSPTSASLAGLLLYYAVITVVASTSIPSSAPKLLIAAIVVAGIAATRRGGQAGPMAVARRVDPRAEHLLVADIKALAYPGIAGPVTVVKDVSLMLESGEVVLLAAPNGFGKTTILRFIAGDLAGSGAVTVRRDSTEQLSWPDVIGFVSQDASLATCAMLTPDEHLALYRAGPGASPFRPWSIDRASESVGALSAGLVGDRPVGVLSGGQRQLMHVGALMVRGQPPSVVLFDEPLTHLDEPNAQRCVDLIRSLRSRGCGILVVQHDLAPEARTGSSARDRLSQLLTRVVHLDRVKPVLNT